MIVVIVLVIVAIMIMVVGRVGSRGRNVPIDCLRRGMLLSLRARLIIQPMSSKRLSVPFVLLLSTPLCHLLYAIRAVWNLNVCGNKKLLFFVFFFPEFGRRCPRKAVRRLRGYTM